MPRRNPDDDWLKEVPEHLREHLKTPPRPTGRPRKDIAGRMPRKPRTPHQAKVFRQAVEARLELMRQDDDQQALVQMPLEVVIEDRMEGEPDPVEWVDLEPEAYEVVDEGEDEEELPLDIPTKERLDQVDVEEACRVMLSAQSYFEAAERLHLTIGELKRLRRRPQFNQVFSIRYETAAKAEPRRYAILPYGYSCPADQRRHTETPLQLRMDEIILTLIRYPTVSEAAKKLGLKPVTLDVLRRDPRFQKRFHERRQEALALGTLILQMDYARINLELLNLYFNPDTPPIVRANIGLQLSRRIEDQIEKEQNKEQMVRQLEQYKAILDRASQTSVEEVTVEAEEN